MPGRTRKPKPPDDYVVALQAAVASSDPQAHLAPLMLAHCWLDSALEPDLVVDLVAGGTLRDAFTSLGVTGFNPQWLLDAGYVAADAAGTVLASADDPAGVAGPVVWTPEVPLHRADDQTNEKEKGVGTSERNKRLAGEVLLTSMWRRAAQAVGVRDDMVARKINGNARGARFRKDIQLFLALSLPGWDFPHEKRLDEIYGLHIRADVGERSSDILALDDSEPRKRLMGVVSAKWTWRSDRGTEAAQMIPLRKYRPDLPYVIVTAEFPRARVVGRESVEDRAYHVAPEWVAPWMALYLEWGDVDWSNLTLDDAIARGTPLYDGLGLDVMPNLVSALRRAGTYG